MRRKWSHRGNWTIHTNNQGFHEMWLPLHAIQKFQKVNDKITITIHGNLHEHAHIKNGISRDLSPLAIILGYPNPDYNKIRIKLGPYSKVYIGTSNSTNQIILGDIALRQENKKDKNYIMSLDTGKQIYSHIWTELPMNENVIHRVYDLDAKGKHPNMKRNTQLINRAQESQ